MVTFIDAHRATYGVEPICAVLPIAPSTYWWHRTRHTDPTQRSRRAHRDETLRVAIQRIWDENEQVYGAEKVWRQLRREDFSVARCTSCALRAYVARSAGVPSKSRRLPIRRRNAPRTS